MEGRLINAVEGIFFAVVVAGIFLIVAITVKKIFGRKIDGPKYYVIAIICGFLLHKGIIVVLNQVQAADPAITSETVSHSANGLDQRYLVPSEEQLEAFPQHLTSAVEALSGEDKHDIKEAINFLTFALMQHAMETEEIDPESVSLLDMAAKTYTRLYRFAQKNGQSMTLRKYVELAEQMKQQRPKWWDDYVEAKTE